MRSDRNQQARSNWLEESDMSTRRFASMIFIPNVNTAVLLPLLFFATPILAASAAEPSIDVCFSPGGGCTQRS